MKRIAFLRQLLSAIVFSFSQLLVLPAAAQDVTIPFPREAIDTGFPFHRLFHEWDMLPIIPGFAREDMTEARFLLNELGDVIARLLSTFDF